MPHTTWETGRQAFAAYQQSLETGNGDPLLNLMADNVTFMVTVPEAGRHVRRGKAELQDLVQWRWRDKQMRATVVVDGITSNDATVGFEYRIDGTVNGQPYKNHIAIFFDVHCDSITGFREYYGDNTTPPDVFIPYGLEPVFREVVPGKGQATQGKPPTLSTTEHVRVSKTTQAIAQQAFDGFKLSVEQGDWQSLLHVLDENVTFTLPIPGRMGGKQHGIAAAAEYHRWRWEDLQMRTPVMLDREVTNGHTVAFEFRVDGTVGNGLRLKHPAVYFMDVQGDKVVGFREYNGDEEDTSQE